MIESDEVTGPGWLREIWARERQMSSFGQGRKEKKYVTTGKASRMWKWDDEAVQQGSHLQKTGWRGPQGRMEGRERVEGSWAGQPQAGQPQME